MSTKKLQKLLNSIPTHLLMEHLDKCEFPKDQDYDNESTIWYLEDRAERVEIKIQNTGVYVKRQ